MRSLEGPRGPIPLLVREPAAPRGTVFLFHGLYACKETHEKELASLAGAGFRAVGVDAPEHGERKVSAAPAEEDFHVRFLELVLAAVEEVPALLEAFPGPHALVGISFGGYISFAAASDPRVRAAVPILGSPDWTRRSSPGPEIPASLAARSPHRAPERLAHAAVFAWNAGRDVNVPAEPARRFMEGLPGQGHAYREYPESDHFMRGEDWEDGWARTLQHLARWLA